MASPGMKSAMTYFAGQLSSVSEKELSGYIGVDSGHHDVAMVLGADGHDGVDDHITGLGQVPTHDARVKIVFVIEVEARTGLVGVAETKHASRVASTAGGYISAVEVLAHGGELEAEWRRFVPVREGGAGQSGHDRDC